MDDPPGAALQPADDGRGGGRRRHRRNVGGGVVFHGSSSMSRSAVSVAPGTTSNTRMPVPASSSRSDFVAWARAALDAE